MGRASVAAVAVFLASVSGVAYGQTANFQTQEGPDTWRASKLSGVAIFGPDNKKVGTITDVMMDHEGRVNAIVIGVGGFLGIGEKNVAVPFDEVKFTDQPTPASQMSTVEPAAGLTGAGPTTTALGMPADATGNPNAPMAGSTLMPSAGGTPGMRTAGAPAAEAPAALGGPADSTVRSTSYPDHGTIELTADQLKSAPSFQFAK